jgi:gamma-glutamyltranspeptidase/glutathione hydrolase
MFCLFYNARTKKVHALNGSGRAAGNITLEGLRKEFNLLPDQRGAIPMTSVHAVTTPGAAAGWVDTVQKFGSGKLSLEQILTPAIELGEEGYPVSELASVFVSEPLSQLRCIYLVFPRLSPSFELTPPT